MTMIGYCKECGDKVILTNELQACQCGNLIAQVGESGEPESAGGNAVIIKMDEDKIIDLCSAAGLFEEDSTIVIDPSFSASTDDTTYKV